MYKDTIRRGSHKCLANEKQEALLWPRNGLTLYCEKCKRSRRTIDGGEDGGGRRGGTNSQHCTRE